MRDQRERSFEIQVRLFVEPLAKVVINGTFLRITRAYDNNVFHIRLLLMCDAWVIFCAEILLYEIDIV